MTRPATAIIVLGTASNVGKSWLCTGLCRLLARRGYRVAPFKAQNMSNNAAPAVGPSGYGEIGRAQAVQAEAAGLTPHVDMNPVLLKPTGMIGSQVVLLGEAVGHLKAREYRARRDEWWAAVTGAYARLSEAFDVVIIEGAGSPAEFNLRDGDIVNMAMAHHAEAHALLVGDIDRGGVFASLMGTLNLLEPGDKERFKGFVINRFRGDPTLLAPALEPFNAMTGIPVRGVIPMREDLDIDAEDSQDLRGGQLVDPSLLDICVVRMPTVSNFTDLEALGRSSEAQVRYVRSPEDVGNPDLLVLPGAKDTLADLAWMRCRGLDAAVIAAAGRGIPTLGLCGGYQLLGRRLLDETGHSGTEGAVAGLGLLPVETTFSGEKYTRPAAGRTRGAWLLPEGLPVEGYEIHQGITTSAEALVELDSGPDGAVAGCVAGTYLHGLLDRPEPQRALLDALRARRGLAPLPPGEVMDPAARRSRQYDGVADVLEQYLDLDGLLPPTR